MSVVEFHKIAIYGVGGVGGFFGGLLLNSGKDVIFIATEKTKDVLLDVGLRIESPKYDLEFHDVKVFSDPSEVGIVDLVIIAVKMQDLAEIAGKLSALMSTLS